jgi:hypothetical protein
MSEEVLNDKKLYENFSIGSRIVSCEERDRQTEMTKIIVANGPKREPLKKSLIIARGELMKLV